MTAIANHRPSRPLLFTSIYLPCHRQRGAMPLSPRGCSAHFASAHTLFTSIYLPCHWPECHAVGRPWLCTPFCINTLWLFHHLSSRGRPQVSRPASRKSQTNPPFFSSHFDLSSVPLADGRFPHVMTDGGLARPVQLPVLLTDQATRLLRPFTSLSPDDRVAQAGPSLTNGHYQQSSPTAFVREGAEALTHSGPEVDFQQIAA